MILNKRTSLHTSRGLTQFPTGRYLPTPRIAFSETLVTLEQWNRAYDAATPAIKELCNSAGWLRDIAEKYGIYPFVGDRSAYKKIAIAGGDLVLGLRPASEIPNFLENHLGVDETTAVKITRDLLDYLGSRHINT